MEQQPPAGVPDPVFVLCAVRSGSTLLRFILDAHPQLGCPPETDLPALCAQLAGTGSLLAGQPLARGRDGAQPPVPGPVLDSVRAAMSGLIRSYLARRGKARYCDKSLFSARHADLLAQVFPGARFICLYRHPMDVIASCIEACPWGLKGFGLDSYAAAAPGNEVQAVARFWADNAAAILAVEERHPGRCHRVRYEDLVADPEGVAAGVFRFLGVPPAPGVSQRCFAPEREQGGPGDYKIWQTSRVSRDSVGRGWTVPPGLINPATAPAVNALADKLGYLRADAAWGIADVPPDLRVRPHDVPSGLRLRPHGAQPAATAQDGQPGYTPTAPVPAPVPAPVLASQPSPAAVRASSSRQAPTIITARSEYPPGRAGAGPAPAAAAGRDRPPAPGPADATGQLPRAYVLLGHLLQQGLFRVSDRFAGRWGPCAAESFLVIATSPGSGSVRWLVSLGARTVTLADGRAGISQAGEAAGAAWQLTGAAATWEQVIGGAVNLNVALRRRELRYCDTGTAAPATTVARVSMLADLLGIVSWRSADSARQAPAPSAA